MTGIGIPKSGKGRDRVVLVLGALVGAAAALIVTGQTNLGLIATVALVVTAIAMLPWALSNVIAFVQGTKGGRLGVAFLVLVATAVLFFALGFFMQARSADPKFVYIVAAVAAGIAIAIVVFDEFALPVSVAGLLVGVIVIGVAANLLHVSVQAGCVDGIVGVAASPPPPSMAEVHVPSVLVAEPSPPPAGEVVLIVTQRHLEADDKQTVESGPFEASIATSSAEPTDPSVLRLNVKRGEDDANLLKFMNALADAERVVVIASQATSPSDGEDAKACAASQ